MMNCELLLTAAALSGIASSCGNQDAEKVAARAVELGVAAAKRFIAHMEADVPPGPCDEEKPASPPVAEGEPK